MTRSLIYSTMIATMVLVTGCEGTIGALTKQECPVGSSPLNATLDANANGEAKAKMETPEGGIDLKVVQQKVLPVQFTAEAKAAFGKSTKAMCLNSMILSSIAKNPNQWVFNMQNDGTFKIESASAAR